MDGEAQLDILFEVTQVNMQLHASYLYGSSHLCGVGLLGA